MRNIAIPQSEFQQRLAHIKSVMAQKDMDVFFVYGDEYRKENLRYVSNFWPIFERGALLMDLPGSPVVLCAPEGEQVAREMSVWDDVRVVPDFICVTVPDEIDYPLVQYTSFKTLADEMRSRGRLRKMGVCGLNDMPSSLLTHIQSAFDCELVDANDILFEMRKIKSENEIACIGEAARIAEIGFREMMQFDLVGKSERQAAAIAEGAARAAGAEAVIFTVFGSGDRSAKIIGRPENKIIEDGDMIMCALAIQYEGYVATCEIPFAVGHYSSETKRVLDVLMQASEQGLPYLKPGDPMKNFVCAIRNHFREHGLSAYDVYPPLHGIGCAEAESPYPDENTTAVFEAGMTVNTDISLFGLPGGSNRIEEGFVITKDGAQTLFPFVREYIEKWVKGGVS